VVAAGSATALALDGSGQPHIAYSASGALTYSSYTGTGWSATTVDEVQSSVGGISLDGSGKAVISYYDAQSKDLKVFGTSTMTVDSQGDMGGTSSLVIDASGGVRLTYYDGTDTGLKSGYWAAGLSARIVAPSELSGSAASATQVQWIWKDNSSNELGFRLYGSVSSSGPFTLVKGTDTLPASAGSGGQVSYTEGGLTLGTTYYRYVAAVNAGGVAVSSAAYAYPQDTTDLTPPVILVNQAGDDVWRRENSGVYDVDATDLGGSLLSKLQVNASTTPGGADPGPWMDAKTSINAGAFSENWALPEAVFTAMLDGATHYVSVKAIDGNANESVRVDAFYVKKDTTLPVIVDNQAGDDVMRPAGGTLYDVDARDGPSGLGGLQYSVSLVAGSGSGGVLPWTDVPITVGATEYASNWGVDFAPLSSDATNYVSVRVWDLAGNTVTLKDAFYVRKDIAGPVVAVTVPSSGSWRSSLGTVSGTASDMSGVGGVEVAVRKWGENYWNGSAFTDLNPDWTAAVGTASWILNPGITWADGSTYEVVVRATDTWNNTSVVYATSTFTMDQTPPVVALSSGIARTTVTALEQIFGAGLDAAAGLAAVEINLQRMSDGKYWDFVAEAWSDSAVSTVPAGTAYWTYTTSEKLRASLADGAGYSIGARGTDYAVPANSGTFAAGGGTFTFRDPGPPSGITNLSALRGSAAGQIQLTWTAPGDDGSTGTVLFGEYRIHYSTDAGVAFSSMSAQVIFSTGMVRPGAWQSRTVGGLTGGATYYLRAWLADDAGRWSPLSNGAASAALESPLSAISGHVVKVTSEGITAVQIDCYDEGGTLVKSTFTAADGSGTFAVDGLLPGKYRLEATWSAEDMVSSVWQDSIEPGSTGVDFVLNLNYALGTLAGSLLAMGDSSPLGFGAMALDRDFTGSRVELHQRGRQVAVAGVDPLGRWEVTNLLPGTYWVRAFNGLEYSEMSEVYLEEGELKEVSLSYDALPEAEVYAFPNPARESAVIRFRSPLYPMEAQVSVFDIAGTLVKEFKGSELESPTPGVYHAAWTLRNDRGESVASGVYLFSVKVKGADGRSGRVVKKIAVVR